jgi:hypothetical protein
MTRGDHEVGTSDDYEFRSTLSRYLCREAKALGYDIAVAEASGETSGHAAAVVIVLEARGIQLTDEVRERILGCTDIEHIKLWLRWAATAPAEADLFAT